MSIYLSESICLCSPRIGPGQRAPLVGAAEPGAAAGGACAEVYVIFISYFL